MISKMAAMLNRSMGAGLPETGWRVRYHGLPLSLEERRMEIEEWERRVELGVASKVDLLMRLEGISEDAARARLERIRRDSTL